MKKLLLSLTIISVLAACSTKQKTEQSRDMVILQDSTAMYQNNINTDKAAKVEEETAVVSEPVSPRKTVRTSTPKKTYNRPARTYQEPSRQSQTPPVVTAPPAPASQTPTTAPSDSKVGTDDNGAGNSTGTTGTTQTEKKTGISKAAKGAVIGAGAGAVAGAILGKNAKGAVIGAVLGAGGGYILGRKQDKKDGRVQ